MLGNAKKCLEMLKNAWKCCLLLEIASYCFLLLKNAWKCLPLLPAADLLLSAAEKANNDTNCQEKNADKDTNQDLVLICKSWGTRDRFVTPKELNEKMMNSTFFYIILQILFSIKKCLLMLANLWKCLVMLANALKCFLMLKNACKCFKILLNA